MRNLGAPLTTIRTGDDAVASFTFLMGAFSPVSSPTEGPFGVGYMVAAIDILEDEGDEAYAEAERAQAEPPQPEPENIVAAAGPKLPLVRLARDAAEAFVRERRVLVPPPSRSPCLPASGGSLSKGKHPPQAPPHPRTPCHSERFRTPPWFHTAYLSEESRRISVFKLSTIHCQPPTAALN